MTENTGFEFLHEVQLRHFERKFEGYPIKSYPRIFKGMLADFFSMKTNQDRPSVTLTGENLFYPRMQRHLVKQQHNSKSQEARLFWNLMQSKVNAATVPQSMIKESYEKHAAILSECHVTSPEILDKFEQFIDEYVKTVVKTLPKYEKAVPLARRKAAFGCKRSNGGVQLINSTQQYLQPDGPRIDPTTMILSGEPGTGKSLIQAHLCRMFEKNEMSSYSRNAMCDHWDGYQQQQLVIIDDFNQSVQTKGNPSQEWEEFITLNSTVDYVLPMADLRDKGKKFNSPLLVYSTNSDLNGILVSSAFTCKSTEAVSRRIDDMVVVERRKGKTFLGFDAEKQVKTINGATRVSYGYEFKEFSNSKLAAAFLYERLMASWSKKSTFYSGEFEDRFQQTCLTNGHGSYGYSYPTEPHGLANVNVQAIAEPLKVRTITIGDKNLYALKPLQRAMFNALEKYPCMKPCFTPDYQDSLQEMFDRTNSRRNWWLSGDYSSATDGLHSDVQQTFTRSLLRELGEGHPLVPYIVADSGIHNLHYPDWTRIPVTKQTNGQLMGSLMSFPILCLANVFTVCDALSSVNSNVTDMTNVPALIHGDDLLARVNHTEYEAWKGVAAQIGLQLSVGKNYLSKNWGSIDSQLYATDNDQKVVKLDTGKYRAFKNDPAYVEQSLRTLISRNVPKSLLVQHFKKSLRLTPRSLDVHTKYGGLDENGRKPETNLEMSVYHEMIKKSIVPRQVANFENGEIIIEAPKELMTNSSMTRYRPVEVVVDRIERNLWSSVKKSRTLLPQYHTFVDTEITVERGHFIVTKDEKLCLTRQAESQIRSTFLTKEDRIWFHALKSVNINY